jgi:sugar phosphate isomerase/epimerase
VTTRRDAVKAMAALAAAGLIPRDTLAATSEPRRIERLGVQLYTVRDAAKKNLLTTIADMRRAGYREVEFAGYHGHALAPLRRALDELGMTAPSTHVGIEDVTTGFGATVDAAHILGVQYLTVASVDTAPLKTADDWKRLADTFNAIGQRAKGAGLTFAFHNHSVEFAPVGGQIPMELLLNGTDASYVTFELDIYWAVKAGQDPRQMFLRHSRRFSMVHLKDATAAPAQTMTEVGAGVIDWTGILALREKAGIRHYFVEHDAPADPMGSVRKSADYLLGLTF